MNPLKKLAVASFVFCSCSASVHAASVPVEVGPSPYNSGSWVWAGTTYVQALFLEFFTEEFNVVSSSDQSGLLQGGFSSSAYTTDLAAGTVGVAASRAGDADGVQRSSAQVSAGIFDTLVFDFGGAESGTVAFSLTMDGTFSNLASSSYGGGIGHIAIADVTGLESSFFFGGRIDDPRFASPTPNSADIQEFGSLLFAAPEYLVFDRSGMALISPDREVDVQSGALSFLDPSSPFFNSFSISDSGESISFMRELTGEFLATAGNSYAFMILNEAFVSGQGGSSLSDMLGTTTFGFTDLSGGSFTSHSGVFPGLSTVSVPSPATLPLLLTGLGLLLLMARRRRTVHLC